MGIAATQPVIRCESITKAYSLTTSARSQAEGEGLITVLNGVDLLVHKGEFVAIVGASGTGKSTLLHILGGLDTPAQGNVYWSEKNIFALENARLALLRGKTVGFVFQFHHLLNEFTAMENIMLPMLIQGARLQDAKLRAQNLLERFSLTERKDHKPSELSGGEQQRIAIARALANNPGILLADEPTGNLDSANSVQLYDLLFELNKNDGLTTVIVTHNLELAGKCDKTYRLESGKLTQL